MNGPQPSRGSRWLVLGLVILLVRLAKRHDVFSSFAWIRLRSLTPQPAISIDALALHRLQLLAPIHCEIGKHRI